MPTLLRWAAVHSVFCSLQCTVPCADAGRHRPYQRRCHGRMCVQLWTLLELCASRSCLHVLFKSVPALVLSLARVVDIFACR